MQFKLLGSAVAALALISTNVYAQTDMRVELRKKFEAELQKLNDSFDGAFGAQFVDLTDGQKISINAENIFPTASTIKVPILIELFRQADQKPDLLKQQRPFNQKTGGGMARLLGEGSSIALEDVAKMMINLSDNTATNILIDELGMDSVNRLLTSMGFKQTKLQRRMLENTAQAKNLENITTPAEAATIMTRIAQCELPVSKAACARIREILEIPQNPHPTKDPIPRNIPIAFKWGGVEGVSCGQAIVGLPDRPYVFSLMTTYGMDAAPTLRAASEAGFNYFSKLARANAYGARVPLDVIRKERPNTKPPGK